MTYAPITAWPAAGEAAGGVSAAAGRFRWLRAAAHALVRGRERAAQRRLLQTLDDRLLADIGHSRADVHRESDKPFWQA